MIVTHAAGFGFGLDQLDLVVGALDQRDPCAAVFGVASLCLFEDALDDGRAGALTTLAVSHLLVATGPVVR
jgi:hypothetical protein